MNEELRQAIEELRARENIYELVDKKYEEVAYHELMAASARVDAIISEYKKGAK